MNAPAGLLRPSPAHPRPHHPPATVLRGADRLRLTTPAPPPPTPTLKPPRRPSAAVRAGVADVLLLAVGLGLFKTYLQVNDGAALGVGRVAYWIGIGTLHVLPPAALAWLIIVAVRRMVGRPRLTDRTWLILGTLTGGAIGLPLLLADSPDFDAAGPLLAGAVITLGVLAATTFAVLQLFDRQHPPAARIIPRFRNRRALRR